MRDLADAAMVADVVERMRPVFECLLATPDVGRAGLVFSVGRDGAQGGIEDLGLHVIGDLSANPYPNAEIARQKRDLSLRIRGPGSLAPALMQRPGDSPWTGSAWLDGIAIGCAGLSEAQDEMAAHWLAFALRAAAIAQQQIDRASER